MNIDPPKKSSFAKLSPSQSNINFNWLDWDSFNSDYFYPHPPNHRPTRDSNKERSSEFQTLQASLCDEKYTVQVNLEN